MDEKINALTLEYHESVEFIHQAIHWRQRF